MTKISATAGMGVKLKIFSDYENVSPMCSITVERDVPAAGELEDWELVEEAGHLYKACRKFVEKEIEKDIEFAKAGKKGKYIGEKVG